MKTVVVSDLHFGHPSQRDLLSRADWQDRLMAELEPDSRLVLLGDVVETVNERTVARARPALERLASAIPGGELIAVVGNHDHTLIDERFTGINDPGLEQLLLPHVAGPDAQALYGGLGVSTTLAYPGVWLDSDIYAWHGHYGDVYSLFPSPERLVAKFGTGEPKGTVRAFERRIRAYPKLRNLVPSGSGAGRARMSDAVVEINGRAIDITLPVAHNADVAALWRAIGRLGIDAPHVLSGHTHHAGQWEHDGMTVWNPGGWVGILDWTDAPQYAPGAIIIDHDGPRLEQWSSSVPDATLAND